MSELTSHYRRMFNILDEHLNEYNSNSIAKKKATNPFLISIPDNYDSYKNRIMIFGQETNGWCSECGNSSEYSNSIDKSIETYREFYLDGRVYNSSSPFWNEFKRIRHEILKEKNALFLWNNVNKIGRVGVGNLQEINNIQFNYFQVIKEEIKAFKPNIMIFLTGPNYDFFIKSNIGEFNQREIYDSIWEITFNDEFLKPIKTIKTYHPKSLYTQRKNRTVIPNLIKEIKNACT